jgi:hypothetical protein
MSSKKVRGGILVEQDGYLTAKGEWVQGKCKVLYPYTADMMRGRLYSFRDRYGPEYDWLRHKPTDFMYPVVEVLSEFLLVVVKLDIVNVDEMLP